MTRFIRTILCAAIAATALTFAAPTTAQADHRDKYWNHYWKWYDGHYRPYYQRHYRHRGWDDDYGYRQRRYYRDYRDYYGGGAYYGTPNFGYRDYGAGGAVRVGPLRVWW